MAMIDPVSGCLIRFAGEVVLVGDLVDGRSGQGRHVCRERLRY